MPFVRPSSFCSVAAASTGAVVHCTCTCCTCTCTQQGRNETKGTCWVVSSSICLLASLGSPAHPTTAETLHTKRAGGLASPPPVAVAGHPIVCLVRHLPLPPPTQAKLNSLQLAPPSPYRERQRQASEGMERMLARLMRRRSSVPLSGLLHHGGAPAPLQAAGATGASPLIFSHQQQQQHTAASAVLPGLKIRDSASQVRTSSQHQ